MGSLVDVDPTDITIVRVQLIAITEDDKSTIPFTTTTAEFNDEDRFSCSSVSSMLAYLNGDFKAKHSLKGTWNIGVNGTDIYYSNDDFFKAGGIIIESAGIFTQEFDTQFS